MSETCLLVQSYDRNSFSIKHFVIFFVNFCRIIETKTSEQFSGGINYDDTFTLRFLPLAMSNNNEQDPYSTQSTGNDRLDIDTQAHSGRDRSTRFVLTSLIHSFFIN